MVHDKIILGVFAQREDAESAIDELKDANFEAKDISVIAKNEEDTHVIHENTGAHVGDGAVSGAATGGVIGGIAGLLVGIGAVTIPGLGPLLIGGPIAAALGLTGAASTTVTGAITGALAGGFVGALVSLGVPEEDARLYEDSIRSGAILIAVPVGERNEDDVRSLLEDNGADRVRGFTFQGSENRHLHA